MLWVSMKHEIYSVWLDSSFKKCVVSVSQREYDKIKELPYSVESHDQTRSVYYGLYAKAYRERFGMEV